MSHPLKRFLIGLLAVAFAMALATPPAQAQAAAEAAMATSKAATGAATIGNALNKGLTKAAEKVSKDIKTNVHESPARVMEENRSKLEKRAGDEGGTLDFTSDPDDAAIFVDGNLIARTPATIKVPPGNHTVKVTRPDRDPWTQEVTVVKGESVPVRAKLVNTNPSVISLSFSDKKE